MFIAGAIVLSLSGQVIATYPNIREYPTLAACKHSVRLHMPAAMRLAHQNYGRKIKVIATCTKKSGGLDAPNVWP